MKLEIVPFKSELYVHGVSWPLFPSIDGDES